MVRVGLLVEGIPFLITRECLNSTAEFRTRPRTYAGKVSDIGQLQVTHGHAIDTLWRYRGGPGRRLIGFPASEIMLSCDKYRVMLDT